MTSEVHLAAPLPLAVGQLINKRWRQALSRDDETHKDSHPSVVTTRCPLCLCVACYRRQLWHYLVNLGTSEFPEPLGVFGNPENFTDMGSFSVPYSEQRVPLSFPYGCG
jgi:hypothetical protein